MTSSTIYILSVLIFGSYVQDVKFQEFESQAACQAKADWINKEALEAGQKDRVKAHCSPKR